MYLATQSISMEEEHTPHFSNNNRLLYPTDDNSFASNALTSSRTARSTPSIGSAQDMQKAP